jgi:hypothetical protein
MLQPFFLEINRDGNMIACREKIQKQNGVECEEINEIKDLFDFIK